MALQYQAGTATSQENLMSQLATFLTTNGWTQDNFDTTNDRAAFHIGTVFVQFHWDNTDDIGVWQSLAYTGGLPGTHTDDSGNTAQNTGAITQGRVFQTVNNGPFINHYFFLSDTQPYYCYVALEVTAGVWRFLGFGEIEKIGDWTGGEFVFGTYWNQSGGQINSYLGSDHSLVWDVACLSAARAGCLHAEGLPGQVASGKWGVFVEPLTIAPGNDTAGIGRVRIMGGSRGGWYGNAFAWFDIAPAQGFNPLLPIPAIYTRVDTSPDHVHLLGYLPNFRQLNMQKYVDAQEITIGSEVWKIFPFNAKIFNLSLTTINQSGDMGYAIRKS